MTKVFLFATKVEKCRVGVATQSAEIAGIADIADIAVIEKATLPLINADDTDQNPGIRKSTPGVNCVSPLDS